ncbi:ATP-binding protein [Taibaiella soli]|uniref:ATP-binding protein n=1 Tax=Taibaiella soli TaxID=1649169 RepID=A0A2W2A8B4_9BACT|nr:ATP-binding protein [Taibaiella soli]PZF71595.1 ATP-binding protein [Taibaiella soli]
MNFEDNTYIKAEGVYYAGILKDIKKHKNPLQPIYEAFTNALESISLVPEKNGNGIIKVQLFLSENLHKEREFYKVIIEDSGVGFNDLEFQRFNTYKDTRKGFSNKGSGRLQLIHSFQNCNYTSIYAENGGYLERRFRIAKSDNHIQENAITFLESTTSSAATEPVTTVSLSNLYSEKEKVHYTINLDELKEKLIAHYIQYFCSHKDVLPKIILESYVNNVLAEEQEIVSTDIPEIDSSKDFAVHYHKLSSDGKNIIECNDTENFTVKAFRINKDKLDKNSIRLTSKDEIVESNEFKIGLSSLSADDLIDNDRFLFLISSPFIDKRDDDQRGELKIAKRENFKKDYDLFSEEEIFLDDIEQEANELIISMYEDIKKKNEDKQVRIDALKSMFLLNDDVLQDITISLNDTEERILEKVYAAESKLIAKGDFEIKKQIEELETLNPASDNYEAEFNEAINKLVKEIPQQNRVALTHYVARRKMVLELFEKILNKKLTIQKTSTRNIDEKLLHNLIFKQHSTHPDTSDLWLVNEDFILFKGTSESKLKDIEIDGVKLLKEQLTEEEQKYRDSLEEDKYGKRPDVLLFPDEGKCIIIEFKAPNVNVGEYINQINRYATLIRNFSKDDYEFDTFYGYLIGEAIDADEVRNFDADFKNAAHFDYVFRPTKAIAGKFGRSDGSLYMEVIKYSTLCERATRRNNVFISKLHEKKHQSDDLPF